MALGGLAGGRLSPVRVEGSYWSWPLAALLPQLGATPAGLSAEEAQHRLERHGPNLLVARRRATLVRLFLAQLRSPLVLILVVASAVAAAVGEWTDATVILAIVLGSALLTGWREAGAAAAIEALRRQLSVRAKVLRDGTAVDLAVERLVSGDVVLLSAGSLIPADGVLLEARDLFVSEAALTGETFPTEKRCAEVAADAPVGERVNCVWMGTSVRSGVGRAVLVHTGRATAYGAIAARLAERPPETDFERGLRHFGYLLTQLMLWLMLVVFAANVLDEKPAIDSLLFAIALAVGISPELLPAILGVTLAEGAKRMAAQGVIVRHLGAIENLGSMDVLCADKTGTLTEGSLTLEAAVDAEGAPATRVYELARWNAALQEGLENPLDEAILAAGDGGTPPLPRKLDEVPYDFLRRRLSVAVELADGRRQLITKGALAEVLAICSHARREGASLPLEAELAASVRERAEGWSESGLRVLAVASRELPPASRYGRECEEGLTLEGFLRFADPPKAGISESIAELQRLGVRLKVISGDNRRVVRHLAKAVGLTTESVLTGAEIALLSDEALQHRAEHTDLFAEVDPNQKEGLILALQRRQHVVGFLGDGINDAPALHAADVGISVDRAVDVAKDAADLVLLRRDLDSLRHGIAEGRRTFANTLKYIYTTSSANFGNMVSMAAASAFLPFLPLLAKQVLLNNFLSDFPALAIAGDRVDPEAVRRPRRWDLHEVRSFMLVFGLVSSLFDLLTFALLLWVVRASADLFRSAWFVESLLSELAVALVVRTRRPAVRSRPSPLLVVSTLVVAVIAVAAPYLPGRELFGLVALPGSVLVLVLATTAAYVLAAEATKAVYYRRHRRASRPPRQ